MTEHFFVYGTLCLGKPNEYIMENISGSWHKASVEGELRAGGWVAELGFPGKCSMKLKWSSTSVY